MFSILVYPYSLHYNVMKLCILALWHFMAIKTCLTMARCILLLRHWMATGNGLSMLKFQHHAASKCIKHHQTPAIPQIITNRISSLHFGHTLARLPCRLSDSTMSLPVARRIRRYVRLPNLGRALALTTLPMTGTLQDTTKMHKNLK